MTSSVVEASFDLRVNSHNLTEPVIHGKVHCWQNKTNIQQFKKEVFVVSPMLHPTGCIMQLHVKEWDRKRPKEATKRQGCANCASRGCFVQCASCTSIEKCIQAGELWCTAKGWCPSNTSHFPPHTSYHTHSQSHTLKDYSGGANIFWCGQYLCHKR